MMRRIKLKFKVFRNERNIHNGMQNYMVYISDYFRNNFLALKILFRIQMEKPKIKTSISLETTILIEAGTRILYFNIAWNLHKGSRKTTVMEITLPKVPF